MKRYLACAIVLIMISSVVAYSEVGLKIKGRLMIGNVME